MSDDVFYHATMDDLGDEFVFDRGGYYEKVNELGTPQQRVASGTFIGYEQSDTPELSASHVPEGAVFAILKNLINETGDAHALEPGVRVNVYELSREPDIDMVNAVAGDFSLLEEVRYRNPSENPIHGELFWSGFIDPMALGDVDLTYLPSGCGINDVIDVWGEKVKGAIRHQIKTGEYPDMETFQPDVERPSIEAYRPGHRTA